MGKWTDAALRARPILQRAAVNLDDADASVIVGLYDGMKYDDALIKAGTRINWKGLLMRAAVDLWDSEEYNPDNAPTLWEKVMYKDGIRIIPEVITATLAFSKGERGWWNDVLYESRIDGNVYTPDQYYAGWAEVTR